MNATLFEITPALRPPPNTAVDFANPDESLVTLIRITVGLCLGVSSGLVLLRTWTRFIIMKAHGWDDYTMILAWLCLIPYSVVGLVATAYGSGVHQWDIPLSKFFVFLRLANVLEIFYNPLIFITKLSILLQYQRIFCPLRNGWTNTIIWLVAGLNFLFYVAVMIAQIMACNPREKIWHPYLPGTCLDLPTILISGAVINIVSDFSILILPLFKIWQLHLSTNKKLGVSAVFATGLFACLASIFRLVNNVRFSHTEDVTWDLTAVALWTFAEISSGIICGCLPALPLFFKHVGPMIKTTFGSLSIKNSLKSEGDTGVSRDSKFKDGVYIELNGRVAPESQEGLASKC